MTQKVMTQHDALLHAAQGYLKARQDMWDMYERRGRITEAAIKREEDAYVGLRQAVEDVTNEL